MKYIKSYNESALTVLQMRNTCKDILLPMLDDYIPIEAFGHHDEMQVHLGDDRVTHSDPTSDMIKIDTKKYKDELSRLIEYMESEGFHFFQFDHYDDFFKSMIPEFEVSSLFDLYGNFSTVYIKLYFERKRNI